jgi:hypothetical protein
MTPDQRKEELLSVLRRISDEEGGDPEASHGEAEKALLKFINDPEISAAWDDAAQFFWYA